jgi:ribosomal protein L3
MTIGLVGRKSGMTRVFTEDGASIPVTVVEVSALLKSKTSRATATERFRLPGAVARPPEYGNHRQGNSPRRESRQALAFGNSVWQTAMKRLKWALSLL